MIFVIGHGGGKSHTGFVESILGGSLHTIEVNADASATREGRDVYKLTRKLAEINKSYIDHRAV